MPSMFMTGRDAFAPVAEAVIVIVGADDQGNGKDKEPVFNGVKKLFHHKEHKTGGKDKNRYQGAVVPRITVKKGISAYQKCQPDHSPFKISIMDDIDAKNRQA